MLDLKNMYGGLLFLVFAVILITISLITGKKKNVDPKRDYSGTMRLWDQTLSYSIKSH